MKTIQIRCACAMLGLASVCAASTPVVTGVTTFVANPGVTVAHQISATGSPTSFAATGLPTGWTINSMTGVVLGRIAPAGTVGTAITFNVTATNADGTSSPASVTYHVVAQAMASQQYRVGSSAATAPVPFWASSPVLPNDTVLVTGGRILPTTIAQLAQLPNTAAGTPAPPSLSSVSWGMVTPGTATSRSVHVGIPAAWDTGIYALRMANESVAGPAILVNAPDPWYAMGDAGSAVSPGGTLYVAGHCLGYTGRTATISLVQNNVVVATMTGNPMASDMRGWSYALSTPMPAVPVGLYEIWVHNGFGGPDGWAKVADPLSVIPSFSWPTATVDFNAMAGANDDARMAAALAAVPATGGSILLPARTINLTTSLVLPKLCRLKGQSRTTTQLSFAGSCTSPLITGWLYPSRVHRDTFALEDLKIHAPAAFIGIAVQRAYQPAYLPGWMKRVDVQLDAPVPKGSSDEAAAAVWFRQTTDFVIEDCVLDSANPIVGRDTVSGLRIARSTANWRINSLHLRGMTSNVIIDACTFNIRGDPTVNRWVEASNPNPGVVFLAGGGPIGGQYIKNILFSNCASTRDDRSYPMPAYVGFTTDGTNSIFYGPFTAAGTTLTLPRPTTTTVAGGAPAVYDWTGCRASILQGTGAGQHRTIVAGATPGMTTLAIDRPWDIAPDSTSIIDIGCQIGNTLLVANDWSEARLVQHYFSGVNNTIAGGIIGSSDGQTTTCVSWSGLHYDGAFPASQMQCLSINNPNSRVNYLVLTSDFSSLPLSSPRYAAQASGVFRDLRESGSGHVTGRTQCGYTSSGTTIHMPVRDLLFERVPGPLTFTSLDDYGGSYAARLVDTVGTTLPTTAVRLSDTPYAIPSPDTTPPTTPTNLAGTATSPTAVSLTWTASTDNVGVAGYRVHRATGTGTPTRIATGFTTPAFTDTGLVAGTAYHYHVVAFDAPGNESPLSSTATVVAHDEVFTTYDAWRSACFGIAAGNDAVAGPFADPDSAGLTNLERFAFGLPSRGPAAPPIRFAFVDDAGVRRPALIFPRKGYAPDLEYIVQTSSDLTNWSDLPAVFPGHPKEIAVVDTLSPASVPCRFLRVRVILTP